MGRHHQCYRLRTVERVFNVSLLKARRRARVGLTDTREVTALEKGFGVSPDWILSDDVEALRAGIVAFGKGKD